jgi:hypothetical protein
MGFRFLAIDTGEADIPSYSVQGRVRLEAFVFLLAPGKPIFSSVPPSFHSGTVGISLYQEIRP